MTPDPETILRTVEAERITKMFCPPTVWIRLLRSPAFDRHDLSSLRKGYYGAAIMPVPVLEELGRRLPDIRLFNYYGQTELAPNATVLFPEEQISKAGTAGRASLNVETRASHDEDDRPVPVGQVGEIVHRTPHAMRGYWGKPDATAEVFRHGWFHSGDLGVMDADGYLTIVDRKKDIIITGGENVAGREVEDAIYAHPAVSEVAVFGVKHPEWIEAVAAAVVLRDGATATAEEIVDGTRGRLAGFKIPSTSSSSTSCRRTRVARSSSGSCGTPTRRWPTGRGDQTALTVPPSTRTSIPVRAPASGEARNAIVAAVSSGSARRPVLMPIWPGRPASRSSCPIPRARAVSAAGPSSAVHRAVRVGPGLTVTARTPRGAYSSDSATVRLVRPALATP